MAAVVWRSSSGVTSRRNFPREPVLILDYWHAAEYLTELAQVLHPHDEAQRQHVLHDWRHRLKYEGGQRLIDLLAALPLPRKNAAVQTKHAEASATTSTAWTIPVT